MNVLSLFDGMSCGMIALERAGIPVTNYYASEIDKYAIKVSHANYPEINQLGCVTEQHDWELPEIDLLIGGSPCQGFSFAGKQLNFDDPRSKLFFEFVNALNFYKPKYFMLENVKMKQEYQDIISNMLGVNPVEINSSLVSGQNRKRLYWTNIGWKKLKYAFECDPCELCDEPFCKDCNKHCYKCECVGPDEEGYYIVDDSAYKLPRDKGIMLKDVVFNDAEDPTVCMHNLYGGFGETKNRTFTEKSPTLRTAAGGGHIPSLLLSEKALSYMDRKVKGGRSHWDFKQSKSAAVVANFFKGVPYNVLKDENCIRHFDPIECERLQTIPDNYTNYVSKTQRYKMIGNGWTIDVIAYIFKGLK